LTPGDELWQLVDVGEELCDQAALTDSWLADDGHELDFAIALSLVEQTPEQREIGLATDERRGQGPDDVGAESRHGRNGAPHGYRLGLPLCRDRHERLVFENTIRRAIGPLPDRHAVDWRRGLDPGRRVHDVARHHSLALLRTRVEGDNGLSRVDSDAHRQSERGVLGVQLLDALEDREARADRALGIVLVRNRRSERGHDRVADELLHRSTERLDAIACPSVVRSDASLHLLRSADSEAAVKPTRSQNSTVTTLRSLVSLPGCSADKAAPQKPQNWNPSGLSRPHAGHVAIARESTTV
jgi:hypothetical protein